MDHQTRNTFPAWAGNLTGAFADGTLLFPLIIALSASTSMNISLLLASTGAFYILAGLFFKIPMPVQPLKSVAISAVALGALALEIRIATFIIGILCLLITLAPVQKFEKYIPRHLIHGVQFSLGILLIMKGAAGLEEQSLLAIAVIATAVISAILIQSRTRIPILGIIATLGIVWALVAPAHPLAPVILPHKNNLDLNLLLALVIPQLALTLTNSVVGTYDAANRYFGHAASALTLKKLLLFIGFGNIVSGLIGGLPFCHGSGGMTAHVKAGAKDSSMNNYIGGFLLVLAMMAHFFNLMIVPHYHPLLISALLAIIGWHHMKLADKSWSVPRLRLIIVTMGTITLLTSNILYALVIGTVIHFILTRRFLGALT